VYHLVTTWIFRRHRLLHGRGNGIFGQGRPAKTHGSKRAER
jgi:hypothetical protein